MICATSDPSIWVWEKKKEKRFLCQQQKESGTNICYFLWVFCHCGILNVQFQSVFGRKISSGQLNVINGELPKKRVRRREDWWFYFVVVTCVLARRSEQVCVGRLSLRHSGPGWLRPERERRVTTIRVMSSVWGRHTPTTTHTPPGQTIQHSYCFKTVCRCNGDFRDERLEASVRSFCSQ